MAWCPKCKAEYVDGIEFCADCKVRLVSSLEEEWSETAVEYPKEDLETILEEVLEELPETVQNPTDLEAAPAAREHVSAYVGSEERANDNRSSAYTLLVIGIIGLTAVVLMAAGILPFFNTSSTRYLTFGVMGVLFVIFIVMGVVSFRNSKKYARKAAFEEELSKNMQKWCLQNLSAQALDGMLSDEERELPDEMLYFQRTNLLRSKILEQYMNLDEGFLEHFIEEIYPEFFGESGEV